MSRADAGGGFLLDTCTIINALADPDALSKAARKAILAGPNTLSVVSYWEVMLKSMKGSLDVGDPRSWWLDALEQLAATVLVLRPQHVSGLSGLAAIHKDPFDRVLIAQAAWEGLTLISADGEIARYASEDLRILS